MNLAVTVSKKFYFTNDFWTLDKESEGHIYLLQ